MINATLLLLYCIAAQKKSLITHLPLISVVFFPHIVISCKKPSAPSHGTVTLKGEQAVYECDIGYNLKGDKERTCLYGLWSGVQPTCGKYVYAYFIPTAGHV